MRGSPALLARGGFHPQAIPGLWVKSSASCLAPRLRAGLFAADSDARRSQTGGTSTAAKQKRKPRQAGCATHLPSYDSLMHCEITGYAAGASIGYSLRLRSPDPMKRKNREPTEVDLLEMFVFEMERHGVNRKLVRMDLDEEAALQIGEKLSVSVSLQRLQTLADKCLAQEWIEHTSIGPNQYSALAITASGLGVVRSRQRKSEIMTNRSLLKKVSDFVEDHKGLFAIIGIILAATTLVLKLLLG